MRTLLRGALLATLLLPALGQAAVARAQLETFDRQLWRISTDHYMITLMDGDQGYSQSLKETARAAGANLRALAAAAESDDEQALVADLEAQWSRFAPTGEGEPARFDEVPAAVTERVNRFEGGQSGDFDDVQQLITDLRRLTATYTAIVAGGAVDQDAFRADLGAFEQRLKRVQAAHRGNEPLAKALEQSRLKWAFMRGSLVKFGDDAVPFLVYRYSQRMSDNLGTAIAPTD